MKYIKVLLYSILLLLYCCNNDKKPINTEGLFSRYDIDTINNISINLESSKMLESIKSSIGNSDFVYFSIFWQDSIKLRVKTGTEVLEAVANRSNVTQFLNSLISAFPITKYKIFKGVDKIDKEEIIYILEFTNIIDEKESNLIKMIFIVKNDKVGTIQVY